jgi:hypothetical protein
MIKALGYYPKKKSSDESFMDVLRETYPKETRAKMKI